MSKLWILLFCMAMVLCGVDYGKADDDVEAAYISKRLDRILRTHSHDYRKEIEREVFKPCLAYYAEKIEILQRRFKQYIPGYSDEHQLSDFVKTLRKMEPHIYYEVIEHNAEMRNALYAVALAKCKTQAKKQTDEVDW